VDLRSFHPWLDEQGESGFVWSIIGAISQACSLPIATAVTCPLIRLHPAIVALAAATSALLTGGQFTLGAGTGEALNEHITGGRWPGAEERLEIAPAVGGIEASDGTRQPADQKVDGGPSVLYDAVVILVSKAGAAELAALPAARDFVTDAYAHCKFIGHTADAMPLLSASGVSSLIDKGFIALDGSSPAEFLAQCGSLRFWSRLNGTG